MVKKNRAQSRLWVFLPHFCDSQNHGQLRFFAISHFNIMNLEPIGGMLYIIEKIFLIPFQWYITRFQNLKIEVGNCKKRYLSRYYTHAHKIVAKKTMHEFLCGFFLPSFVIVLDPEASQFSVVVVVLRRRRILLPWW